MTEPQVFDYPGVEAALRERRVEWELDPTIDRVRDLVDLLGSPQHAYPVIHVAGTNGKTTTARMIETLLRARGLRTGLMTSPELRSIRERIAIDGEPISEEAFVEAYQEIAPYVEMIDDKHGVRLSFFEVVTAMAYAAFADAPVDVAVVEVGMGGVWDATNVADGAVAVLTPIGLDHTRHLGDTIEEIAAEKAGIIKDGAIVVMAQQPLDAAEVLLRRAAESRAQVAREGIEFGVVERELAFGGQLLAIKGLHGVYDEIFLPLFGDHQARNAACALAAVEAFAGGAPTAGEANLDAVTRGAAPEPFDSGEGGEGRLDPRLVRAGLAGVSSPGRLEIVRTGPTVLLDVSHNPAGMDATVHTLTEDFGFTRLIAVVAAAGDKDITGMLEHLEPVVDELVVTRNSSPRSMPPEELGELAEGIFGLDRVHVVPRLDDAIDQAIGLAEETGEYQGAGVVITGSVVTAGDARVMLRVDER
ncbi:bifunctional folylpolyglutamate synthase/dihydrofolate synthase [Actinomadura sp. HBU206391]|uniref:bifunctional folylpolyglutamate synthase/dihydrofolate synthase n=1 Tax=Actinomadura sp. HBU206391 TaxID=2731692 RepID=UPI00164F7766|nr:folylpolyglutamate synthase/dihydrofolate synthase family protein [Actinomadura sp. HBU206391]MBC6461561.1 bifunctional folylpolyglutamate synthase/dihydrofolate synthase [Actinomadura sp. HBU206391]